MTVVRDHWTPTPKLMEIARDRERVGAAQATIARPGGRVPTAAQEFVDEVFSDPDLRDPRGYILPAGGTVIMPQYVVHRDPRFYEDPERFHPSRWADGLQARIPKYAYYPFGGGQRVCIGNTFAMMESVLILASLCRRWRSSL